MIVSDLEIDIASPSFASLFTNHDTNIDNIIIAILNGVTLIKEERTPIWSPADQVTIPNVAAFFKVY